MDSEKAKDIFCWPSQINQMDIQKLLELWKFNQRIITNCQEIVSPI